MLMEAMRRKERRVTGFGGGGVILSDVMTRKWIPESMRQLDLQLFVMELLQDQACFRGYEQGMKHVVEGCVMQGGRGTDQHEDQMVYLHEY